MLRALPVDEWIAGTTPIIDVRSPGEFQRGRIPGACNLPLFTDEERAVVGTLYKQEGRDRAVIEGLRAVGPKLAWFVEEAQRVAPDGRVRMHCWRGGERSGSMGWLLDKAGFADVCTLKLGYKGFRNRVQLDLKGTYDLRVLGGYTGTGKTGTLRHLRELGQQVIDLEALASHKGSAFGSLGEKPQPTTEQFENLLWEALRGIDPARPLWIEDESLMIGRVHIPPAFHAAMREAILYFVDLPQTARIEQLVELYGAYPKELLAEAIKRIAKRLGPQHCKSALEALELDELDRVAAITLRYYDKAYLHGVSSRDPEQVIHLPIAPSALGSLAEYLIHRDAERQ